MPNEFLSDSARGLPSGPASRVFAPSDLPDPYAPMNPPARLVQTTSVQRQWRQRAKITAATRRLLAERGAEHLRVGEIAEACGVTAQTIYNNFGPRHDLVATALNEYATMMGRFALSRADEPLALLVMPQTYATCAAMVPAYIRESSFASFSKTSPLVAELTRHGSRMIASILRRYAPLGVFRQGCDIAMLCDQLSRMGASVLYEWAVGKHDDAELRRQCIMGNAFLLMGAINTAQHGRFESWLSDNLACR